MNYFHNYDENDEYDEYDDNDYNYYDNDYNFDYDQHQSNGNEENEYYKNNFKDYIKMNTANNSNKAQKLTIEEAISKSSYPKYIQDFVKNFIINNYSNNKNTKVYLVAINNEKIFSIKYNLPINLKNKIYYVQLLIYIPILYPNYEPEFYISKKINNINLNNYYKDGKIDEKNLRINIERFVRFNPEQNNIEEIVNKLKEEFKKEFPVYKTNENNIQNENIGDNGKCILNKELSNEIILPNTNANYINNIVEENNNLKTNDNNKIIKNNYEEKKKDFNDESFLEFIRNQTKDILREKYMNYKEKFKMEKNQKELKNINKSTKNKLNKVQNNKKINEMRKNMELLKIIKDKLNSTEKILIQEIEKIKIENKKSSFDKCNKYISIKNKKFMEYTAMKKAIEDYLVYLKKGYEKDVISFKDIVKETRLYSREMFYIEYLRNKEKALSSK